MKEKSKSLDSISIEGCYLHTRLFCNINTENIHIRTSHIGLIQKRKNNKEKTRKQQKQWRENNQEKIKETNARYYGDHKEEILNRAMQYYEDHKEKTRKQQKQYYENTPKIVFLNKKFPSDIPRVRPGYIHHHYCYDHLNTSDYIVDMPVGDHTTLHYQLRRDGIDIQHINVRINDIHGF